MKINTKTAFRFAEKVVFGSANDCWNWVGAIKDNGYGNFYADGKTISAHRAAYILAYGTILSEQIMHTCDNRRCVNPHHLLNGTRQQNMEDMVLKGRSSSGEKRWNTTLTRERVNYMRKMFLSGKTPSQISKLLNYKYGTVYQIVTNRRWIEKA